ncbi:F-box domain-containing protein [Favolaschia claudopus]|uniref:F-box domain-containing protein n=1 Tax=Favolaschia claudopus TaxID=2862362 RepID=A0AAW0DG01_9AGAR
MLRTLAADRKRIADIDAKLLVNGDGSPELLFEKEVAQKRLDDYKYPVLTLPNEIISEIFELLVPFYPVCPPQAGLSSPTLLSHICSTWRQIAIATPRLWRAIAVSFSRGSKSMASRRQIELAEVWLRRSGCCPLSLEVHRDATREIRKNGGHGHRIYTVMAAHRERWEHLRVSSTIIGRQVFRGPMPLLRSVSLDDARASPAIAFDQAPLLRSLSVQLSRYLDSGNPLATVTLPFLQFTSLTLDTRVLPSIAPMLGQFENLTHFELDILEYFITMPIIRLARLKSLVLQDKQYPIRWRESYEVLEHLSTPALRRLMLSISLITPWRSDRVLRALISFINASACKLEELCIIVIDSHNNRCDVERDLPHFRRAFPAIPEISLQKAEST